MRKLLAAATACVAAASAAGAADNAPEMTVEEVIARHVEAKGGDAWDDVETMRLRGEFTAFSKTSPFVAHRARDRRYHIDHKMNDRRVVMGFDGELHWWENEFGSGGPQPIASPVDLAAFERELDFATPLFDYEEHGYKVKLVPERDEIDGFPAIAIELERGDGSVETWFLDPETYLELARESPGSDFGQPRTALTFFDDFREVEGVMIPHYVESQWYTRDRVQRIAEVEINADFDPEVFTLPVATGMEAFQDLVGEWNVKVESKRDPRQPDFTESSREAMITASLNGGLIEERYESADGTAAVRTLSYDRYREHYVLTQMNEIQTYLDVQTGQLEDGVLEVSNVDTGTSFTTFGATVHERSTISSVTMEGFTITRESSIDGGQSWGVVQKLTYSRKRG